MENNWIYWFSAKNEQKKANEIKKVLSIKIEHSDRLQYAVTIEEL